MQILFVAMASSIHTVRWTRQLAGRGWDLHLFPSQGYDVHEGHREITIHGRSLFLFRSLDPSVHVRGVKWPFPRNVLYGQAERFLPRYIDESRRLARLVDQLRPDVVHSLEIQHGGYLTLAAKRLAEKPFPPWIVTNWGNDTYYFRQFPHHEGKLREVFAACDYYDCECERDVAAARELGFRGESFPVTPNTGGFDLDRVAQLRQAGPTSARRVVMIKGYQNWAGRALAALQAVEAAADALRDFEIVIYSPAACVRREARRLQHRSGLRIRLLGRVGHEEMLRWHGRARMSLGISVTDGVSTSFLEALVMGSFPIQTNTACCDEWIRHGETGWSVKPDDIPAIAEGIRRAAHDDELVDRAAELNRQTAQKRLDASELRQQALEMYHRVVENAAAT